MRMMRTRAIVSLGAATLLVGACAAGSTPSPAAKNATSAADMGGMDALVTAAKAEGTLNVIALPPDWRRREAAPHQPPP